MILELWQTTIPVEVKGISSTSWLVGLLNLLVGGALVAWIKTRPKNQEISNQRRKDELEALRERVEALEKKVDEQQEEIAKADGKAHDAEMRLVYAVNAIQLLNGHVAASDPKAPILQQTRELLAMATGMPMPGVGSKLWDGLNQIRGTGE